MTLFSMQVATMLCFPNADDNKLLSSFIRQQVDDDLELFVGAAETIETEYIEPLFPKFLWVQDKEKCIKRFYEL